MQTNSDESLKDRHLLAAASADEFQTAIENCPLPIWLWNEDDGHIRLANQTASTLTGIPLDELVGTPVVDRVDPPADFEKVKAALDAGIVEDYTAQRRLVRRGADPLPVYVWTRSIKLDGHRGGLTLFVPVADAAAFERDTTRPWRELSAVTVGTCDLAWTILVISADVRQVLGGEPADWIGCNLNEMIHPEDRLRIEEINAARGPGARSYFGLRIKNIDGDWVVACMLCAEGEPGWGFERLFAIIEAARQPTTDDRVAELESRLRRIGAEVRAAGLLNGFNMPSASDFPELADLTTRQWEILTRIVRGERVPTIAREMHLSQSTVRNHLSTVFRKFAVHSQPELINLLRSRPSR